MLTSLKKINQSFVYLPFVIKHTNPLNSYFDNNAEQPVHNPPASKEWFNNVYGYNKNSVKTLPSTDRLVNRLIKSYFNLGKLKNQKKSKKIQVRFTRLSLKRILVSRAEINHTNNKATIYVYFYNRNKKIFLYKLKNLYETLIFKKISLLKKKFSLNNKPMIKKLNDKKIKNVQKNNKFSTSKIKTRVFTTRILKKSNITRKIRRAYTRLFTDLKIKNINRLFFRLHAISRKSKSLLNKHYFLISLPNLLSGHNNNISKNYFVSVLDKSENFSDIIENKSSLSNSKPVAALSTETEIQKTNNLPKLSENKNLFFTTRVNKKTDYSSYENILSKNALKSANKIKKNFLLYKLRILHKLIVSSYNFSDKNALSEKDYLKNLVGMNIPKILKKSKSSLKSTFLSKRQETKLIKKINFVTIKSLKILKKVRKHKRFLFKILK